LHNFSRLEIITSSIGSLSKLNKLSITYCESLETFSSSIFKLKLTKLDLHGCLMLKTFPEILEPAGNFVHINLTKTAIKGLPSSLENLVGLQTLCLKFCTELVSLPNSIVNLNYLSELDCSGCCSLTEIPNNIGSLSSLRELSLQESNIVSLPESIAHLSSLKSLDLSDCKRLECIPQLPPSLNQLLACEHVIVQPLGE
jgi:Leucine-rich repeat (LRR) protein